MTPVSSLLLEDNIGKDGLSSQLTYKDNIVDFDAPGMIVTSLLEHNLPNPLLNNIYGTKMKVLNEMRVQITLKTTTNRLFSTAMISSTVFNDSSSSSVNWGVGTPNVMLHWTNPRTIAGHVALVPSSDTNSIIA
jgi:hypothetical protein